MEIRYCPDDEFKLAVKKLKAELENFDGHLRWVVRISEDQKYIIRPESARTTDDK